MKKLQTLYPEARIAKKRAETDNLATNYVQALYGFLPCLDLTSDLQGGIATDILDLANHIMKIQQRISGETTQPLQGVAVNEPEEPQELAEDERQIMVDAIRVYGIYAGKDENTDVIYVSHPSIQGRAHTLNERELYEIVCSIVATEKQEGN